MRTISRGMVAVFIAAASCAMTHPSTSMPPQAGKAPCARFGLIDRNDDRRISRAEWGAFRSGAFADWDANKDNRLSPAEFEGCWRAGGFTSIGFAAEDWDENFGTFDENADTVLEPTEFFSDDEFDTMDADRDLGIEPEIGEWGF